MEEIRITKPLIVMCALAAPGHTWGMIQIAEYLVQEDFQVFFVGGKKFEPSIKAAGAELFEANFEVDPEAVKKQMTLPPGSARLEFGLKHYFVDTMAYRFGRLVIALEDVRARFPEEEIIIIHESLYMGLLPLIYGAPLPRGFSSLPRVINFHTSLLSIKSIDTAPFGPGLPPDSSLEGRAKHRKLYEEAEPREQSITNYANNALRALGATKPLEGHLLDAVLRVHDVTLLPCSPSLEYSRSDVPSNIRFIGGLPLKTIDPTFEIPNWWEELKTDIAQNLGDARKRLVFVSQGTSIRDHEQLLHPAISGLGSLENAIVVVTLGAKGHALPEIPIPPNTRVVAYVPYDLILPLTDVFVTNGGYGGFMHGVMNGVPMVLAGQAADKAEVSMRAEWSGIGVNLRTQFPTPDLIREGVEKVLGDQKYKSRALKLKEENEGLDSLAAIKAEVLR